jgi:hypothetical protein
MRGKVYCGIHKDPEGAMNPTGNIIRDAWVFGLIPDTETCEGWTAQRVSGLYDQVSQEWDKYGHMVSQLPPDLANRHRAIYDAAIANARQLGWDPNGALDDD